MDVQKGNFGEDNLFRYHFHEEVYNFPIHIHQFVELVFIDEGELYVTVDGQEEIARGGDMILIFPFQTHSYRSDKMSIFNIYTFSPWFIIDYMETHKGYRGKRAVFPASEATRALFGMRISHGDYNYYGIRSCLYSMLADYAAYVPLAADKGDKDLLGKIISYMNLHIREELSLSDVAKGIGYSANYLSHVMKKFFGFGFCKLLGILRVEEAKPLLSKSQKTSLEIAMECGFGSERTFHRQFKDVTGKSPKEYRRGTVLSVQDLNILYPDTVPEYKRAEIGTPTE